ncbi:MAG: hypothetical protein U9O94_09070 [Nanoarchaeota archaeon]|nr:hypothetical protein [Nanoarchaeota archaeon]
MVEKKFVIDGMRLNYDGPFNVIEFYQKVEDWIQSKGKEKEIKNKSEHVEPNGKNIEWFLEIWENVTEYARSLVRIRVILKDVKDFKPKKKTKKRNLSKGKVLIIFDGILETDIEGRWQQKSIYYFIRALADKFVHKFYMNKIEDKLAADVNDLYDALTDFFHSYPK